MTMLRFFSRAIFIVLVPGPATLGADDSASQAVLPPNWDEFMETAMAAWSVPGVAMAVVKDGELVHSGGYGVRVAMF